MQESIWKNGKQKQEMASTDAIKQVIAHTALEVSQGYSVRDSWRR